MASKSAYHAAEKGAEIEELLDALETLLERLRALYEQYFLGIAKMAPTQLHTDAERRIRDLTQIQIKNTALRYRFATLSQKFGAYNTYWKRTLRLIEQGKYVRDLQRVKRQAEKTGEAIPEEILAAMPKLMRERVQRDRAAAIHVADKVQQTREEKAARKGGGNVHRLDEALVPEDVDVDGLFATLTREAEEAIDAAPRIVTRPAATETRPRPPVPPPIPPLPPRPPATSGRGVPPPRAAEPASHLGPPPGMSDAETRSLYQRYLKARELCGESNDGVTYDRLLRTLRSQSSKIITDHKAKGVEFGVVIKDNRVVLKAKPKL